MIKLVVFDWNGTLLADVHAALEGFNKEMEVFKHPTVTLKDYREHREVPFSRFMENIGINLKTYQASGQEAVKAFHAHYEPRASRTRTRIGTRQLLETLTTKNINAIILSNHTVKGINFQLKRLKLECYFERILANTDIHTSQTSGKQAMLQQYLKSSAIQPTQVAIVGDTTEEIEIGKSLGLKTIAITGGYNSNKRLKAAKPDILINKLSEIINALEEF